MNQLTPEPSNKPQNLCRPGTAFGLGMIPGVGALCNGEYLGAFVHLVIFWFFISTLANGPELSSLQPIFVMFFVAFCFYMPIEAYHTAKRRLLESKGLLVPEVKNPKKEGLWMGLVLTVMGVLLFMDHIVHGFLEWVFKLWPVALIGFGSVEIARHFKKEET